MKKDIKAELTAQYNELQSKSREVLDKLLEIKKKKELELHKTIVGKYYKCRYSNSTTYYYVYKFVSKTEQRVKTISIHFYDGNDIITITKIDERVSMFTELGFKEITKEQYLKQYHKAINKINKIVE